MDRDSLRTLVGSLDEQQLLGLVKVWPRPVLRNLQRLFGIRDCACELGNGLELAPCPCAGPCSCPVAHRVTCPHAVDDHRRDRDNSAAPGSLVDLPLSVQALLLQRLYPDKYADPPLPARPSKVLLREAYAQVMADRAGRKGCEHALRHPKDNMVLQFEGKLRASRLERPAHGQRAAGSGPGRLMVGEVCLRKGA